MSTRGRTARAVSCRIGATAECEELTERKCHARGWSQPNCQQGSGELLEGHSEPLGSPRRSVRMFWHRPERRFGEENRSHAEGPQDLRQLSSNTAGGAGNSSSNTRYCNDISKAVDVVATISRDAGKRDLSRLVDSLCRPSSSRSLTVSALPLLASGASLERSGPFTREAKKQKQRHRRKLALDCNTGSTNAENDIPHVVNGRVVPPACT